ncbi:hypothetical protein [Leptospira noguchii]|uniref:hypothetical protein n=1 Tax=Leptospira noguchii TaxID=28182 RepID=UPI000773005F|nr:hypothetical protein [Leptospira noguchii]
MENKIIAQNDMNNAFDAAIFGNYAIFTGEEEFFVFDISDFNSPKGIFKQKVKDPKWKFVSNSTWLACTTNYHNSFAFHLLNESGKKFEIYSSILKNHFVRSFYFVDSNRLWAVISNND